MSESKSWKKGTVANMKYKEDENFISEIYICYRIM